MVALCIKFLHGNEIGKCILSNIIYGDNHLIDRYYIDDFIVQKNNSEDVKFDFTTEFENEDKMVIKQFINLRKNIFESNPNATIRIAGRNIAVEDNGNVSFYLINEGNIVPMKIQGKQDLNFKLGEIQKEKRELAIQPNNSSIFANLINLIKRKWQFLKNKNKTVIAPNYDNSQKVTKSKHEDIREKYKVQPEKLQPKHNEKVNPTNNHNEKNNENTR